MPDPQPAPQPAPQPVAPMANPATSPTPGLSTVLQDQDGGYSMIRLVLSAWSLGVLAVWIYSSLLQKTLAPIPDMVVVLLSALTTGKVVQRFGENSKQTGADFKNLPKVSN